MNGFTRSLIPAAYAVARTKPQDGQIDADALSSALFHFWFVLRRDTLVRWSDALLQQAAGALTDDQIEELVDIIAAQLQDRHEFSEPPLWEPLDDLEHVELRAEQARYIADGLAGLWWLAHEDSEIAPLLEYRSSELDAWLARGKQ